MKKKIIFGAVIFTFVLLLVALGLCKYPSQFKGTSTETIKTSNKPTTKRTSVKTIDSVDLNKHIPNHMNSDNDLLRNYSAFISGLFENRMAQQAHHWVDNNQNTFYSDLKCKHKIENKNIKFIATIGVPVNPPGTNYTVNAYKMLDGRLCFCPIDTQINWGVEYAFELKDDIPTVEKNVLLKSYSAFINALFQPQSVVYHWVDVNNNTFYSDIHCNKKINQDIRFASNKCIYTSYDLLLDVGTYLMTDGKLCFYDFLFTNDGNPKVKLKKIY